MTGERTQRGVGVSYGVAHARADTTFAGLTLKAALGLRSLRAAPKSDNHVIFFYNTLKSSALQIAW
jgi:hypothetical protein